MFGHYWNYIKSAGMSNIEGWSATGAEITKTLFLHWDILPRI